MAPQAITASAVSLGRERGLPRALPSAPEVAFPRALPSALEVAFPRAPPSVRELQLIDESVVEPIAVGELDISHLPEEGESGRALAD
jgi:hypothetical protein